MSCESDFIIYRNNTTRIRVQLEDRDGVAVTQATGTATLRAKGGAAVASADALTLIEEGAGFYYAIVPALDFTISRGVLVVTGTDQIGNAFTIEAPVQVKNRND